VARDLKQVDKEMAEVDMLIKGFCDELGIDFWN
jgi:hypothetical protein